MGAFVTLTSNGQLTIPRDVLEELNLKPGTQFYVSLRDGHVVAVPKTGKLADLAGRLGPAPNGVRLSVDDMADAVAELAGEDDTKAMLDWVPATR